MSIKKRMQLVENGIPQDIDILTSAECVTFEDGDTLQAKLDNGDLVSSDVLGDVDGLDGSVVDSLNELNDSAKETSELVSELANRGGVTSALRKEVASGEWKQLTSLIFDFKYGNAIVYNNEIHILGGTGGKVRHYKYVMSGTYYWTSVSTLPYEFYQGEAVILDGEIHILGGTGYTTKHYKYNGSTWESVSTLPYNFRASSAVVLDNKIHIMGSGDTNYYKYHYKFNGSSWSSVSTLPYTLCVGSAVVYNNQIHIMGGSDNSSSAIGKYHYKYNGSTWESVSTLPCNLVNGDSVVYNNQIHIFIASKHYKYNGSSWSSVSTLPYSFLNGGVVVLDNKINILGSDSASNTSIPKYYYKAGFGTTLKGYSKADTEIYLPISTTPITSNITATEDGYTVTEDGYVEILLNE